MRCNDARKRDRAIVNDASSLDAWSVKELDLFVSS
jgi:hypothetical protein